MARDKSDSVSKGASDQGAAHAEALNKLQSLLEEIKDQNGTVAVLQAGLTSRDDRRFKNRLIAGLMLLLGLSLCFNSVQYSHTPEPKLLGETADGRIRPLPLLSQPLYSHKEIMEWSSKCVSSIYRLSWFDWETTVANESFCLSDGARKSFPAGLAKAGIMQYLNPVNQGSVFAVVGIPVMKNYQMNEKGYYEWVVEVPYRVNIDGKQRGGLDLVMTMKVRRVSLALRDKGLWVERYLVAPRGVQTR